MKRILNLLLLISIVVTLMAPLTGVVVHKLAATAFLLLCLIHIAGYRENMNGKRWAVLAMVLTAFISGIFGLIYDGIPMILGIHKVVSIALAWFLAIHIFLYFHKLRGN